MVLRYPVPFTIIRHKYKKLSVFQHKLVTAALFIAEPNLAPPLKEWNSLMHHILAPECVLRLRLVLPFRCSYPWVREEATFVM
jgi:hypothetical protein